MPNTNLPPEYRLVLEIGRLKSQLLALQTTSAAREAYQNLRIAALETAMQSIMPGYQPPAEPTDPDPIDPE